MTKLQTKLSLRQRYESLPSFLRNRYVLVLLGFAIYITFFDHYSLIKQAQLNTTLNELHEEKAQYSQIIEESKTLRTTIEADEEKFARERYFMKHADEDVFVIE